MNANLQKNLIYTNFRIVIDFFQNIENKKGG